MDAGNFILGNARAYEDKIFRQRLIEAARETNQAEKNRKFDAILATDETKDVYKLDASKQLINDFTFEPIEYTMQDFMVHLKGAKNPLSHLFNIGEVDYYNSMLQGAILAGNPDDPQRQWEPLARVSPNCSQSENSCVVYTDRSQSQVDWITTMCNLKRTARNLHYNEEKIETAIYRLSSWFEGSAVELILRNMTLTEKARYLMSKTRRSNPYVQLLQTLHDIVRYKGQPLYNVLNECLGVAQALYVKEKAEVKKNKINKLMLHCLLCFTEGNIRTAIKTMVDRATMHQQELPSWDGIAQSAEQSELHIGLPETDLPYKKKQTDTVELFNLRLGGIDEETPGQYRDQTDGLGVDHYRTYKKGYATHTLPVQYRPTLDHPLGQGPPGELPPPPRQQHQGQPEGEEHIRRNVENNEDNRQHNVSIEAQRNAMGHLLSSNTPTKARNQPSTSQEQNQKTEDNDRRYPGYMGNRDYGQQSHKAKQPNKPTKAAKNYGPHEMTTRQKSSNNQKIQQDQRQNDDASINYMDKRTDKRSYSPRYNRSRSPRYRRYRSRSNERGRNRSYSRRSYSRNRNEYYTRKRSFSRDNQTRRNSSPYRRNSSYSRNYNRQRNERSRSFSGQRNRSYERRNVHSRNSSRDRYNQNGRRNDRSSSRNERESRNTEKRSDRRENRSPSASGNRSRYSPWRNSSRNDRYSRSYTRSRSPANREAELNAIETFDEKTELDIITNCFETGNRKNDSEDADLLAGMTPILNLD